MNNKYEKILIKLCKKASKKGEMPVSALIVKNNKIISKGYNKKNIKKNSLLHAEVICLQKAFKKLKRWNLNDCEIFVTLEPCTMCREIIQEARIKKVYYFLKKGECTNKYFKTKYEQMYASDCDQFKDLIQIFFNNLRK